MLSTIPTTHQTYLRWATRADIPTIARILRDNLLDFEFHDHFCPKRKENPEEFYLFALGRVRMFFVKPCIRFMVAEKLELSVSGHQRTKIVGFSTWDAQGKDNPIAKEWRRQDSGWLQAIERKLIDLELANYRYLQNTIFEYDAFQRAWRLLHESYAHIESLESNLHLQFLMVDPAWHGRHGIGHKLLQWGLDVADAVGLPVVIESSLMGYPFYLKHGCKLLTHVRIDVVPEKAYDMPILVYEPEGKEGVFV